MLTNRQQLVARHAREHPDINPIERQSRREKHSGTATEETPRIVLSAARRVLFVVVVVAVCSFHTFSFQRRRRRPLRSTSNIKRKTAWL